ncbi:MAG: hypothetical protein AB7P14_18255 [Blastocatellales bacterium]
MTRLRTTFFANALFILLAFAAGVMAQTPTPASSSGLTPDTQLLRALLEEQRALREEVRQLRAVILRTNITTYRAQKLTDQLAQQQSHVDGLAEQIEQLKAQTQQSLQGNGDEQELRDLEAAIQAADPQTRPQLIQVYESLKRSIERQREYAQQEVAQNRIRQQQLEALLQNEQIRLADIREQLEALDRDLDKQLADGKKAR